MNRIRNSKQWLCMCMVVFFTIGMLNSLGHVKTVSGKVYGSENGFAAKQHMAIDREQATSNGQILPIETFEGMDDFEMASSVRRGQKNESEIMRCVVFFVFITLLLVFKCHIKRYRICSSKKQIFYLHIVTFIHQMDGKKRVLFCSMS